MRTERWGTFSVNDHLRQNAFVADVLLYDKLAIPYPPDEDEKERWNDSKWKPDELLKKMEILENGNLLIPIPWNNIVKEAYASRYAMVDDIGEGVKTKLEDPYFASRATIAEGFLPAASKGVIKVWPMIAYPAMNKYVEDQQHKTKEEKQQELCIMLSHQFLVPEDQSKSGDELLKQAVKLASRDDFKLKREELYNWQKEIIENNISDDKALEDMEQKLIAYNEVIKKSKLKLALRYGFLAIEVGLGMAGAKLGAPIETCAALAAITRFTVFDSKLELNADDCKAASMIHDFKKEFKVR